jgi:hypothetical protein
LACHHDEANRTEFPLLIDPTSIPNADTRNQAAFIVKAGINYPHPTGRCRFRSKPQWHG